MKSNLLSPIYIETDEIVTPNDIREAERLEMDLDTILRLVDLMFLFQEETKVIPS